VADGADRRAAGGCGEVEVIERGRPLIAKENEARREASKFDKAKASEAARATVNTKTDSPSKRDAKEMNARSTVGQVAAKAGTCDGSSPIPRKTDFRHMSHDGQPTTTVGFPSPHGGAYGQHRE
jgi:hypothetical protein